MLIVVTGLIATYPLGGVAWDYVQYLQGFHRLGHEVYYLEDTGQWLYDPRRQTFTDNCSGHVAYLEQVLATVAPEMARRWCFRTPDGEYFGLAAREIERVCGRADLFLNVSGACWLREEYRGARGKIYLDTDPLYTQYKLEAVRSGTANGDQAFSVDLILKHDLFFTFAENIGDPSCGVPDGGLRWRTTRQPIVLANWPYSYTPAALSYTTVMSWKTDVTLPSVGGKTYGGKDVEFMKFVALPERVRPPLEIAVSGQAPLDELRRRRWRIVDGYECSATTDAYHRYLRGSRGEWSVAKNAYVASRSGWFSTRTAAYLALGKPAVVQDTGFRKYYPADAGLFAFASMEEAVAAIETIEHDYRHHCEAARAIAENEFASDKVLSRLLADADLRIAGSAGEPRF